VKTYIALLRGINVGGHRKLLMKDLKVLLANIGFTNISTYIQSGNVVFQYDTTISNQELANQISNKIKDVYEYDVPVVIRTVDEIKSVTENAPYQSEPIENRLIAYLNNIPNQENIALANQVEFPPDEYQIMDNHIYFLFNQPIHKSKINNNWFEKKLKITATTRNWKTTLKLIDMAEKIS
jgi:uncharacterized protein (DUF1697 family)